MFLTRLTQLFNAKQGAVRLRLSIGLSVMLFIAFLGLQLIDFDGFGWREGFSHPLTGWDHLVTMLAVGIWAAQLRGRAIWMLPLAFVGVMSLGGLAGSLGISIPSVEGLILLSCAVFSVLITRKVRFSTKINVMIVAFFGFFHGFAHGHEISASASLVSYTLGFMLATLLLHGTGILVAKLVVVAISCLFGLIVSNTAMAGTMSESMLDGGTKVSFTDSGFDLTITQQNGYFVLSEPHSVRDIDKPVDTATFIGKLDSVSNLGQLPPPQKMASWRDFCVSLSMPDDLILSRLSFKHFFPDINQTPGTQLLSNGVGLTSPPLAISHCSSPQTVLNFHSISISNVGSLTLQISLAKQSFGDTLLITQFADNADALSLSALLRLFTSATPIARRFSDAHYRPATTHHQTQIQILADCARIFFTTTTTT